MKPSLKRLLLVAVLLPAGCTPPSSSDDAGVPAVFSASGSLVPGFGGGIVTSNPSGGNDEAAAIVVDDEYFYVAGTQRGTGSSSEVQWRIEKRSIEDGALVASLTSDPSASVDEPKAMATDGTALYVVGTENAVWRVEKRLMSDLSLVSSFGAAGAVTNSPVGFFSAPAAVAMDESHLYIVGKDNNQWRIEKRRLDTGALETAGFGANTGVVLSDPTFAGDEARAIAIDATFMYVAGVEGGAAWRIEKRDLKTGELDPTGFGSMTGAITIEPGTGSDEATAIAIHENFLYVAGFDAPGFMLDRRWRIEKRSLSTGDLETTDFGGGTGFVTSDPSLGDDQPVALVIGPGAPSTSFLTIGFDEDETSKRWRVEKRNLTTGLLEAGFATGGILAEDPSPGDDRPLAAAFTDPAHVLLAGFDSGLMDHEWRVARWNSDDGSLSPFGGIGEIEGLEPGKAKATAADAEFLYVAGEVERNGFRTWKIEKRRKDNGALVLAIQGGQFGVDCSLGGLAIDDEFMYVVGSVGDHGLMEKRRLIDGQLSVDFGNQNGRVVVNAGEKTHLEGIALLSPDLYVVGWFQVAGDIIGSELLQKRSLADGAMDMGFGQAGTILGDWGKARAIALDPPYMFVAGEAATAYWRVEKRTLSDGGLVSTFGSAGGLGAGPGTLFVDPGPPANLSVDIAVAGSWIYIAGLSDAYVQGDSPTWAIQKRSTQDGTLDPSFGVGGTASSNPGNPLGALVAGGGDHAFAIDETAAYFAGRADNVWHIEKWKLADGSRDLSFGVNGVVRENSPLGGTGNVHSVVITSEHLFAVGFASGLWRIEKRLK